MRHYTLLAILLAGCSSAPVSPPPGAILAPNAECARLMKEIGRYYRIRGGSICFLPTSGPFGSMQCAEKVPCSMVFEKAEELRIK